MAQQPQRYVLLDRDGVINRPVHGGHVAQWAQFEFLPRVLEALRLLAENGYGAIVLSNQPAVGNKLMSVSALESITRRFLTEVALAGGNITQVYYCVHIPEDRCACRQPEPGAIYRSQLDYHFVREVTYFVGDSVDHVQAAASAGCPTILLRRGAFLESHATSDSSPEVACDLYEAAARVVARQTTTDSWPENLVPRARTEKFLQVGRG